MDVFNLRSHLITDYSEYASSFIQISDIRIRERVEESLSQGVFWPDALIQLNPTFQPGAAVTELVKRKILQPECERIFRSGKDKGAGKPLQFHQHQLDAILAAQAGENYILTTGTGSGKSLSYIVPIVDHVLKHGSGKGIQAIIVYPMNALANSQAGELEKYLKFGYPDGKPPVTFARYTGQETDEQRQQILSNPPDILLTNYVMLELIMTRPRERKFIDRAIGLRFLVLDELHTYRGRQGADVALLVRRVRERVQRGILQCVGTSATLASEGTFAERNARIAEVGTQLFGSPVKSEYVISETLQRATDPFDEADSAFANTLAEILQDNHLSTPIRYADFVTHPISRWIEATFGIVEREGRLVRQEPLSISGEVGAAHRLSDLTGIAETTCAEMIQRWLLAGYECAPNPTTGFRPFAFRLHQFISPADTAYATIEPEDHRYITLNGQQFVPGDRDKVLFPMCFCRECGQDYYVVRIDTTDARDRKIRPREFSDRLPDDNTEAGYLYLSNDMPWPTDPEAVAKALPEDWVEEKNGLPRIKSHRRKQLPRYVRIRPDGSDAADGQDAVYIQSPFMFCLKCGVAYSPRQGDFGKLASLSSEGRSSATTILSLSAILALRNTDLRPEAKKLLSFTDNRQDASLQAGHFNDFIEVGLLRGAIYRAALNAGEVGLRHENIAQAVFDSLALPIELYASDPSVRFQALQEVQKALRQVLGYRIYRDLRRGWRVTSPNLEQCGLLQIGYESLYEVCAAPDVWEHCHPALADSSAETRAKIAKVLLDHMRRELAIKVDYLEPRYQEQMKQSSSQRLTAPWAMDEDEKLEYASIMLPRPSSGDDSGEFKYLGERGGFGLYLRRTGTFPTYRDKITLDETRQIIRQLLEGLRVAGLVEIVQEPRDATDVPGYQLVASAMVWRAGSGDLPFHDPIRVPRAAETGGYTNPFFKKFYQQVERSLIGLEAKEHTAQVPVKDRIEREDLFKTAKLPIMYCSPTMELGVDIAELNVVNLRNVPPTPANYAQRSGRAGRSGQPALVITYCSSGSSHDQYFFKRPGAMVGGAVAPPRLDLTNEDLLRAHLHAVWLSEAGINLGDTLTDILEMSGLPPTLALNPQIRSEVESLAARAAAAARAKNILSTISDLQAMDALIDTTMNNIAQTFDSACQRWRGLYLSAFKQAETQGRVIRDASRKADDKRQAERLRREAEAQLKLLTEIDQLAQSDFYSYRYFATEGFLPGYSFPRLPISAFIPGRRTKQKDEFLSRPRFLAISEFGPRAIIYHEGSRYIINQVIMPVAEVNEDAEPITQAVKQCTNCGYIHPISNDHSPDLCVRCGNRLDIPLKNLLRLQNVVTKRRDRINSDEEERLRLGYEIRTGVQFAERGGRADVQTATVRWGDEELVRLTYAQAGTIWRLNLGWARRKDRANYGFVLDTERGYWGRNEQTEDDPSDPMSARTKKVIPFVEDKRNCLLFEPQVSLNAAQMASLQAAFKRAIEARFQLEDNELAAEPLPAMNERRLLLFYEAAEGGAGVLRRLIAEPELLREVAAHALAICHYDPLTGNDLDHAPKVTERCEAACYYCLLSYGNQRDHAILDRKSIRDFLGQLQNAVVESSPTAQPRVKHVESLKTMTDSSLEQDWLDYLQQRGYQLPDQSQVLFADCQTRPDFVYSAHYAVIYVDGAPHQYLHRRDRDAELTACMEDLGYTVIRFGMSDDWDVILRRYPRLFGEGNR